MQGIPAARLESLLAPDQQSTPPSIDRSLWRGLLEWDGDGLRFTDSGILLSDTVLADLL